MTSERTGAEIEQLLGTVRAQHLDGHNDGQLLTQFLTGGDESAFEALLRRHGSMVLGVCHRLLGNAADAEDAFQATFLVLVRKAAALKNRLVVGAWLHGVARRTALNARRQAARRRRQEEALARREAPAEASRDSRLPWLDEELSRLPEKYRLPIVLCDLEGRTRQEAAGRLGWPEGTVAGRLARGRALLARRLVRQGLTLSAGALASAIIPQPASAAVPAALVSNTLRAATLIATGPTVAGAVSPLILELTEGVLRSMFLSKLKTITVALLLLVVLGAGVSASVFAYQAPASGSATAVKSDKNSPKPPDSRAQAPPKQESATPVPAPADRIKPGDLLKIEGVDLLPDAPLKGVFQVEPSGKVSLGPKYGRVEVQGLTLEEAEKHIGAQLQRLVRDAVVSVTRPVRGAEDVRELEHRVQQLEKEVQLLRSAVDELRKKSGSNK